MPALHELTEHLKEHAHVIVRLRLNCCDCHRLRLRVQMSSCARALWTGTSFAMLLHEK